MKTGYSSYQYKQIYSKHGRIFSDSIIRKIPGTEYYDSINVYPFLIGSVYDFNAYGFPVITTTIISNPLLKEDSGEIFKQHAVVDLQKYDEKQLPENHKRNIKKGKGLNISHINITKEEIDNLNLNYSNLIQRHNISPEAWTYYSKAQLELLATVPGAFVFKVDDGANYSIFYID